MARKRMQQNARAWHGASSLPLKFMPNLAAERCTFYLSLLILLAFLFAVGFFFLFFVFDTSIILKDDQPFYLSS